MYNDTEYILPITYSSSFIAVGIGYRDSNATTIDGAPRIRRFGKVLIKVNTGYATEDTSYTAFFIGLGS